MITALVIHLLGRVLGNEESPINTAYWFWCLICAMILDIKLINKI